MREPTQPVPRPDPATIRRSTRSPDLRSTNPAEPTPTENPATIDSAPHRFVLKIGIPGGVSCQVTEEERS